MTQTLEKRKTPTLRDHLEGEAFKCAVAKALPKHLSADRFVRVALTAMTRTPKLAQCDQASFFNCLLSLSQFGLEPDGRRAHLIPFENRKRGVTECQLILDYKGIVELAMRGGTVASIHSDKVCDADVFEVDRGGITKHTINYKQPRGAAYAYYCLIRFKDGGEKCEVMTREEIEAVRSRSRAGQSGPWVTDFDEMAKKTVFKRASKWITLSPEIMDALEVDEPDGHAAIPVFSSSEFIVDASEPEQIADSEAPTPTKTVTPDSASKAAAPAEFQPGIKDDLANKVIEAGHTFDEFMAAAVELGHLTPEAKATITSFDELPQEKAKFFVKNIKGLLSAIERMKDKVAS